MGVGVGCSMLLRVVDGCAAGSESGREKCVETAATVRGGSRGRN